MSSITATVKTIVINANIVAIYYPTQLTCKISTTNITAKVK